MKRDDRKVKIRICPDCGVNQLDKGYRFCSECAYIRKRISGDEFIALNSQKVKTSWANYVINNKETVKDYHIQYAIDNKEKLKKYNKQYQIDNKIKLKKYRAERYIRNKRKEVMVSVVATSKKNF